MKWRSVKPKPWFGRRRITTTFGCMALLLVSCNIFSANAAIIYIFFSNNGEYAAAQLLLLLLQQLILLQTRIFICFCVRYAGGHCLNVTSMVFYLLRWRTSETGKTRLIIVFSNGELAMLVIIGCSWCSLLLLLFLLKTCVVGCARSQNVPICAYIHLRYKW